MKFTKRDIPKGDGTGGLFLRLKDGESRVGILRGEVYEFFQVWENGKPRLVGPDNEEGKSRFRLNFITKEDGQLKAKIFEFGLTVYNMLADIADDYEVDKTAVKITRRGTGTDTVYMIIPSKEQPTAAQMKPYDQMDLNILAHKDAPEKSAPSDEEELPF